MLALRLGVVQSEIVKDVLKELSHSVKSLYEEVFDPLAERTAFRKRPTDGELFGEPLVLLIGNHSSGKSTFINHLLGQEIQRTGMAPTDDNFTLITYGDRREERDGAAIVSNPELSYAGLSRFGPEFLSHFQMRKLPNVLVRDMTLVDSPGTIDAATRDSSGRGYDFEGVVRWFAERADAVILFFDPDRPGTTTETLSVLTNSLVRMDHKLMVVMNKMDQFRSLRDFARCYGTLCWNLGKVINKKDIPQIFTTYVPVPGAPEPVLPLDDFESAREELVQEIKRAPARRVDNVLTQASTHAEALKIHVKVGSVVLKKLRELRAFLQFAFLTPAVLLLVLGVYGLMESWVGWLPALGLGLAAVLGVSGHYVTKFLLQKKEEELIDNLDPIFEDIFREDRVIRNRSEDLVMLWEGVKPITRKTLKELGAKSFHLPKGKHMRALETALEEKIPALRAEYSRKISNREVSVSGQWSR
ncbi:MAG: dynamin family protein [Opitutales bacterium]|nr:dynamin family protein [Opitutales bacterium]